MAERLSNPTAPVTLYRRLSTMSAAPFGLSYICPVVIASTFGVIAQQSQGAMAPAYMAATVAMILTASSYGRMAARFPEAGSLYTYVSQTTNPVLGLVIGWVLMLDYFFIPMVICLITAKVFEVLIPGVSFRVWVIFVAAFATGANLLGIKVADQVNLSIMTAQLAAMAGLIVVCVKYLHVGGSSVTGPAAEPIARTAATLPAVMGAAAIACYSFLGFDTVTTLSEEPQAPRVAFRKLRSLPPWLAAPSS